MKPQHWPKSTVFPKRQAPRLIILMQCPKCNGRATCDVYLGVAMCGACKGEPFMEPKELVGIYFDGQTPKPEYVELGDGIVGEIREGHGG